MGAEGGGGARMSEKSQERRLSIALSSLFTTIPDSLSFSSSDKSPKCPTKSPRTFDAGAVGLGILAALSGGEGGVVGAHDPAPPAPPVMIAASGSSPRSVPIPIAPGKAVMKVGWRLPVAEVEEEEDDDDEAELSESYTCVILRVGNESARKREYFEKPKAVVGGAGDNFRNFGVPAVSPPIVVADFLSACYLCRKKLDGLDIFMYKGDKAFCSVECRCKQILSDEHKEKCVSGTLKPFDCSVSPCSAPRLFTAGVAAA
ncbi:hypothetical protein ACLOJK_030877 [Asimina triloba]